MQWSHPVNLNYFFLFQRPTSKADILDCKLSLQRGKTKGRQCCGGFDTFNPRFETCCQRGLKSAVRHRNKKEREHAYVKVKRFKMTILVLLIKTQQHKMIYTLWTQYQYLMQKFGNATDVERSQF